MTLEEEQSSHWELGSEFHWLGWPHGPLAGWPHPARWYMLARHAVRALVQMKSAGSPTLWLPSYFCPEVAEYCGGDCRIREYRDLPQWTEPDWNSLQAERNDIVLAVNYFGVRDGGSWKRWRERTACVVLEDHSQDPFSEWARTSIADFAFASVRKTLPVADGAILWSPRSLALPEQPVDGDWSGAALKMGAMIYKMEYLQGAGTDALKRQFRDLQLKGEALMRRSRISAMSPASFAYVADGVPEAWRRQRAGNARLLAGNLRHSDRIHCMFEIWPEGMAPFALPITFSTEQERDACQALLQKNRIYCPVHWVCQTSDSEALALSRTILSLPVDQRYTDRDIDCISRVLLAAESVGVSEEMSGGGAAR